MVKIRRSKIWEGQKFGQRWRWHGVRGCTQSLFDEEQIEKIWSVTPYTDECIPNVYVVILSCCRAMTTVFGAKYKKSFYFLFPDFQLLRIFSAGFFSVSKKDTRTPNSNIPPHSTSSSSIRTLSPAWYFIFVPVRIGEGVKKLKEAEWQENIKLAYPLISLLLFVPFFFQNTNRK